MTNSSSPYEFDEFFASDMEETLSPFLTKFSKKIAGNLSLKSSLLALILLIISYGLYFFNNPYSDFFLVGVYFLTGTPALIDSLYDLREFDVNIDVLMTLAALLSIFIGSAHEGGLLLVLFALSGALEEAVTYKTKSAIKQLHKLSPTLAYAKNESGHFIQKSIKLIQKNDIILIKAGEVIPLDGIVIDGTSHVNMSHITGESLPQLKKLGEEVQAGSSNLDGILTIKVTSIHSESTLSKIINLITQAQESKPKVQKFLDKFSRSYASSIISLSFLFALLIPQLFSMPYFGNDGSIYRALSFLIAASPCALIIATPTAYLSALSACAKKGILLKGGILLDSFAECKKIAFDKTGTLTTGKLHLETIKPISKVSYSLDEVLQIAASIEQAAKHPIAEIITLEARSKDLTLLPLENVKTVAGMGITAFVIFKGEKKSVRIGRKAFIEESQKLPSNEDLSGKIAAYISIDDEVYVFYFNDEIKNGLKEILIKLKETLKIQIFMLTGDHKSSAEQIAKELGIMEIYYDLRPEDKLRLISDLSESTNIAMVGDGINDAPSLARAHVGISMGAIGSKTAIDASDVVFLNDDISLIPWLLRKSRKTQQIVRMNLIFAFSVICSASLLALFGIIPLWLAVILHEGGTILVGMNSLRLLKK